MIISTPEELRLHLPNHAYDDISDMFGAFRNAEADILKNVVGAPLYQRMVQEYEKIDETERKPWLLQINGPNPWAELTYLSQQIVVFDGFMRRADINALSINQSGINVVSAENYDAASKDGIANYKKQLYKELHDAINRLLVWLEELAKEKTPSDSPSMGSEPSGEGQSPVVSGSSADTNSQLSTLNSQLEIVSLWKQSKYYYLIAELFISTATAFQHFVDIHDSREKFINLLPDIRYCQRQYIENELGDTLTADLLQKHMNGTGNDKEKKLIEKIQEALALSVEARSKMFNRPDARNEAIGSIARMVEYLQWNILDFDPTAAQSFPMYEVAKEQAEQRAAAHAAPPTPPQTPWVNNQPGCAMFVTPALY